MILPLLFGLIGAAILIGLGQWQMQRLQWKLGMLSEIEARIMAEPVALPAEGQGTPFQPVRAEGRLTGEYLRVLVSRKLVGPGYRIIAVLETGGRRVLVDLGFLPDGEAVPALTGAAEIVGNLHDPVEVDSHTPTPDLTKNLWFARDVPAMAAALTTEPTFIVAREQVLPEIEALPIDTSVIPNDHLGYAVTWFSLAAGWLGMTALFLWRIRRRTA